MYAPHVTYDGINDAFWQKNVPLPCDCCIVWFCMRFLIYTEEMYCRSIPSTNSDKRLVGINIYLASSRRS